MEKVTDFKNDVSTCLQLLKKTLLLMAEDMDGVSQYVSCAMLSVRKKRVADRRKFLDKQISFLRTGFKSHFTM